MSVRKIKSNRENGAGDEMNNNSADKKNLKNGNDDTSMTFNSKIADIQRDKTVFRAHNKALDADKFNPARLDNAIQQKLLDN
jgi:hypothetical protein